MCVNSDECMPRTPVFGIQQFIKCASKENMKDSDKPLLVDNEVQRSTLSVDTKITFYKSSRRQERIL